MKLVKRNASLKILHVPPVASTMFIADVIQNPELEFQSEELSLSLNFTPENPMPDNVEVFYNFLAMQNSLKCFRLEGCVLRHAHAQRLLRLNLVRLELIRCRWQLDPNVNFRENTTIESLAFIGFPELEGDRFAIRQFMGACKNLSAFVVLLTLPGVGMALPACGDGINVLLLKSVDIEWRTPKEILWANVRSLRFAGSVLIAEFLNKTYCKYRTYHDEIKEVSVENHPFSIIEFTNKPYRCKISMNKLETKQSCIINSMMQPKF